MPRISGTHSVQSFTVGFRETMILDSNLDIQASGDIEIFGRLVADARTAPGSGVRLATSGGNILVAGRIATAPGRPGSDPPVSTSAVATDGTAGGAIEIATATGFVLILQGAELETGGGGNGGTATAEGTQSETTLVKAISGLGGAGGPITIAGADFMAIEGALTSGPGGNGGSAFATGSAPGLPPPVAPPDANLPWGNPPPPPPPPRDAPRPAAPDPNLFPAVVEATAKSGGAGGDIIITSNTKVGVLQLGGAIRTGPGGNSLSAIALSGGLRSTALLEAGGRGGNLSISLLESSLALQGTASEIRPGSGGDCGDTSMIGQMNPNDPNAPPIFWVDNAIATSGRAALAWVGHPAEEGKPAGGAAGLVSAVALYPGPPDITDPIALTVIQGSGGNSTGAFASNPTKEEHKSGINNTGPVPGGVLKVEVV